MKPKFSLLYALAIATVAGTAPAQDVVRPIPLEPPSRPTPPLAPPIPPATPQEARGLPDALKPFDINEDGRLSREEYKAYIDHQRPEALKSPWDADEDGKLSPAEIAAARAVMRAELEQRILARFNEADSDENGSLDLEEFLATMPGDVGRQRATTAFARLDIDGDGVVGTGEFLEFQGLRPDVPPPPRTRPETPKPTTPVVPPLPDHLKAIDSNGDGILSRSEIVEAMDKGLWPPRPQPPTDDEEEEDDDEDEEEDDEEEDDDDVEDDADTETPADPDTEA